MFGEFPAWAIYARHVKGLTLQNVGLYLDEKDFRPAIVLDDVQDGAFAEVNLPTGSQSQ